MIKSWRANAGDTRDLGSIPGLARSPGEGDGYPLQYSCLENPMLDVMHISIIDREIDPVQR